VVATQYAVGEFGGLDYASLETEARSTSEKELANLATAEVPGEVASQTLVRSGPPAIEIIEAAKSLQADLIIISTHGYTGLKHVMLGSVAEHVVRRAPCPVLVVREREHEFLAPQNPNCSP
jgi:nucleotide-binding universal stress UspA family protein